MCFRESVPDSTKKFLFEIEFSVDPFRHYILFPEGETKQNSGKIEFSVA